MEGISVPARYCTVGGPHFLLRGEERGRGRRLSGCLTGFMLGLVGFATVVAFLSPVGSQSCELFVTSGRLLRFGGLECPFAKK